MTPSDSLMTSCAFTTLRDPSPVVEHEAGPKPACVMRNDLPPRVKVPVRDELPGFAATEYLAKPLPTPEPPGETVSQVESLVAIQAQSLVTVIPTVPLPDPTTAVAPGPERAKLQAEVDRKSTRLNSSHLG